MSKVFFPVFFLVISLVSCGGKNIEQKPLTRVEKVHVVKPKPVPKEEKKAPEVLPVKKIAPAEKKKFSEYLVDVKYYSTNGGYYQNKYEDRILSVVGKLIKGLGLKISPGTFGFYFDKKSTRTDRLYIGLDILIDKKKLPSAGQDNAGEYSRYAVAVIKENTMKILNEIYKHGVILKEKEIVGVVIGYKWVHMGMRQQVNIWIKEDDIYLTYQGKLTVNEMLQRSTVTDTVGKVILLSI